MSRKYQAFCEIYVSKVFQILQKKFLGRQNFGDRLLREDLDKDIANAVFFWEGDSTFWINFDSLKNRRWSPRILQNQPSLFCLFWRLLALHQNGGQDPFHPWIRFWLAVNFLFIYLLRWNETPIKYLGGVLQIVIAMISRKYLCPSL